MDRDSNFTGTSSTDSKPAPTVYRYDGFISYSHDPRQSAIASALQQAVQQFAKPFWKRHAVTLFRDQTNLSVDPNLWERIVDALRNSRFLILLASPKAAASPWVAKEIEWWMVHRGPDTVLIVLTAGSMLWSGGRFSDAGTSALPVTARTAFGAEPLWLNLTGVAPDLSGEGWRRDARFLDAVASVASRLRGIPKEDLFGEDLRRHKQTRRAISTTISGVTALLLIAIGAAVFAEWQRRIAVQGADEKAAAFIWSRLQFEQMDNPRTAASVQALWELTTSTSDIRDAFLRQLASDPSQVETLASAPSSIMRAFGLQPEASKIQNLLNPVLDAMRQPADALRLRQLAQTVEILGPTPHQAKAARGPVLDAIQKTTDYKELPDLAQASHLLNPTRDQTSAAIRHLLDLMVTSAPDEVLSAAQAVQILGPNVDQARATLYHLLEAIPGASSRDQLQRLARAIHGLARTLVPAQTRAEFGRLYSGHQHRILELRPDLAILDPSAERISAALSSALGAIHETFGRERLQSLVEVVQVLGPHVTSQQARVVIGPILDAMPRTYDDDKGRVRQRGGISLTSWGGH